MRIYLFILFCLIISEPITVDAQNSLDSLISIFETSDSDNARSQYLNEINDLVDNTVSKDSVTAVWDKLIQICQVSEYENGINFCKYNKAKELRFKGEFFESLSLFNEVLTYYESVDNPAMVAKIHNSLGIFYKNVEDYDLAKKHYLKSIDIQRTLPDSVPLAWYYLNLGSLEEDMRDYKDAIQNLKKSEPILKKYDQKNLVNYYINFGDLYSEMGNADSAYASLSRAYQLAAENEPIEERFHSAFHLGLFLFNNNRLNESEPYLLEAETLKSNYIIADFSIDDQIRFYDIMRKYYNKKGDFEKAYNFFVMQHELEHQNTREQFQNERNLLFFEREMRLQELKNNRSRLIILITLIVLILSIVFILLLYRNYKHKQKANRLLTEMDELKTRMFSDISHELRTPLTMIIAPLEQMLSKEAKEKPSRKQIKLMRKNANAILNLINQILDLSKIDAKSMKLELVNADIVSFIRSHFVAFASVAQQKDISFNSYTPPGKKMQLFDAAKLEKIINNLISNALKYTPKNGQVFCFANFPKSDQLELVIQDTGKGIQPEELPRIFDRFH
jgi:signal transduction histidine kinase